MMVREFGDEMIGERIACEARKIKDPEVISKSGKHKAQRTILNNNAYCVVEKALKYRSK